LAQTPSRLIGAGLLVLVALGGAGLAVAADRPHTAQQRPELTWAADQAAQPWIESARERLETIEEHVGSASAAGRDTLGRLQSLDVDGVRESLAAGAAAVVAADEENAALGSVLAEAQPQVQSWRLGQATADRWTRVNAANGSANSVVMSWIVIEDRATVVAELVDALAVHDAAVARATTAGREARWDEAIRELAGATSAIDQAGDFRDRLEPVADVTTLTDLLTRYAAYDQALLALYEHVSETGQRSGPDFERLERAVDGAQAALPGDDRVLSAIVADAAGAAIADALIDLERVRGDIRAALDDEVAL
jgi:hypothetical protein